MLTVRIGPTCPYPCPVNSELENEPIVMKTIHKFILAGLLAASTVISTAWAQDRATSFEGKVSAINKSAQTVVVDGQTYQVLPTTRLTRNGRNATIADFTKGQKVVGTYKKSAENKLEVISLDVDRASNKNVGGTSDRAATDSAKSFNGTVAKVNVSDQTLKVGTRIYQILPTTIIHNKAGKQGTLADIKDDQHVNGTFKKSAEGKLEVLTLDVGRKAQ